MLLGNGDGTFRQGSQDSIGNQVANLALADVDGDGRTDILTPGTDIAPEVAGTMRAGRAAERAGDGGRLDLGAGHRRPARRRAAGPGQKPAGRAR